MHKGRVELADTRFDVAGNVRAAMGRARLNASDMSRRYGGAVTYWTRRINGDMALSSDDIARISEACGVHPAELFGGRPPARWRPDPAYVNGGYGPHTLRHRYATRIYAATGDVLAVQQLLGHASLATTQTYLGLSEDRLIAAAAAAA